MDFDAGQQPPDLGHDTSDQPESPRPRGMGDPVKQKGMQPRIAQHDFNVRPRGGIARHERLNVFLDPVKSHIRFNPLENRSPYYIFYGLSGA